MFDCVDRLCVLDLPRLDMILFIVRRLNKDLVLSMLEFGFLKKVLGKINEHDPIWTSTACMLQETKQDQGRPHHQGLSGGGYLHL